MHASFPGLDSYSVIDDLSGKEEDEAEEPRPRSNKQRP